ncbi:YybS family protein [Natronorubrum halophilum]|uniref:YybS family protein n=1 Tax=Natronorubrum halophilum TaxID=1702106 RepID=UPI001EE80E64|nr:YybS family protein [Natronorubrum halophilum]
MLALGSPAITPPSDAAVEQQKPMVTVDDDSSIWPYTSRATTFEERTLAINMVIAGDPAETRQHLEERSRGEWNETTPDQEDVSADGPDDPVGTATAWGRADGSTRYTYVNPSDDSSGGLWLGESYQLHDGEYFGSRHHIRAYESPTDDEWTAIQAHSEHWDWFRLGHTVDSVETSQRYVEREFMDRRYVANVTRVHLGNDHGSDANGWVTIVDLENGSPLHFALVGLLPGAMLANRLSSRTAMRAVATSRVSRALVLAGSLIGLYLGIRFGALAVETRFSDAGPKLVVRAFYPLLVVGLPACTYYLARSLDRQTAFAAGSIGFAVAILFDYTLLGVTRLPVNVLVHRFSTAIALGFIAAGASHTVRVDPEDHDLVRLGVLLWIVTVFVPLLRFL